MINCALMNLANKSRMAYNTHTRGLRACGERSPSLPLFIGSPAFRIIRSKCCALALGALRTCRNRARHRHLMICVCVSCVSCYIHSACSLYASGAGSTPAGHDILVRTRTNCTRTCTVLYMIEVRAVRLSRQPTTEKFAHAHLICGLR